MYAQRLLIVLSMFALAGMASNAAAAAFPYPLEGKQGVVGEMTATTATDPQDTLLDIGRMHDMGYDQIVQANPDVNRWVPAPGRRIVIPSRYVLPAAPHEGLVLNLPELRLYYFPPAKSGAPRAVRTYPVSIGRMDWNTPLGRTTVVRKDRNPAWYPTPSIRAEHLRDGDPLPAFIPGGRADNPLGAYALRLGRAGYLIHGVDQPKAFGIGMRVTHGCVRMYPEDIEELFPLVSVGTPVTIVDQPIKAGREGRAIYLEVHRAFEEDEESHVQISAEEAASVLRAVVLEGTEIDWDAVEEAVRIGDGIPRRVDLHSAPVRPAFDDYAPDPDEPL